MKLMDWWRGFARRERTVLALGAVVLLVTIIYLVLESVIQERRRLTAEIPQLQEDLAWMQAHVDDVRQWRDTVRPPDDAEGRAVTPALVQEVLRHAGLAGQVSDLRSGGERGVTVAFDTVIYAELMEFLHQLEVRSGARVSQARFRRLEDKAGMVEASLLLSPASEQ